MFGLFCTMAHKKGVYAPVRAAPSDGALCITEPTAVRVGGLALEATGAGEYSYVRMKATYLLSSLDQNIT